MGRGTYHLQTEDDKAHFSEEAFAGLKLFVILVAVLLVDALTQGILDR